MCCGFVSDVIGMFCSDLVCGVSFRVGAWVRLCCVGLSCVGLWCCIVLLCLSCDVYFGVDCVCLI